jgi:hypothetical protein
MHIFPRDGCGIVALRIQNAGLEQSPYFELVPMTSAPPGLLDNHWGKVSDE